MLRDVEEYLTEQPNSYNVAPASDFDNKTTERVYWFQKQYRAKIQKNIEPSDVGLDDDGWLIDYSFRSAVGYDELTVKFSNRPPNGLYPAVRINMLKPNYYLSQTQGNIPLWQLKDENGLVIYRTTWNYNLATNSASASIPAWVATADDLVIPSADASNYQWISEPTQLRTGWRILVEKTKQGVENQLNFDAILREELYVRSADDVSSSNVYYDLIVITDARMLVEKKETYGYSGGEWLAVPSTIDHEGDVLKITNTYYHALTWDQDIYPDRAT